MSEDRFLEIETKLAYQEDLVASLNRIVSDQQRKLDELETACRKLVDRVVEQGEELAALRIQDAPPPHSLRRNAAAARIEARAHRWLLFSDQRGRNDVANALLEPRV